MEKAVQVLSIIGMVIELVSAAMETVEDLMDPGTGKMKKEAVLAMAKQAVGDEMFAKLEKWISVFINLKAMVNFGSSAKAPN